MDFASDADKSDFIALRGLIKNNQGLWKSDKQAAFQMKRARDDRDFLLSNFGLLVHETEKVLFVNAMYQWAGNRQSRGLVPTLIAFVIDPLGIAAQYNIGGNGNLKQGWKPNPEKCKLIWTRNPGRHAVLASQGSTVGASKSSPKKEKSMSKLYPTYDHSQFTWHREMRRFTAEASSLRWEPGDYESAMFIVGKTGKSLMFTLQQSDEESFTYVMSSNSAKDNPALADITVVVFNT